MGEERSGGCQICNCKKNKSDPFLIACLLFFGFVASGWANPELVQQAFDNMAEQPGVAWSYTQTTTDEDDIRVERCERQDGACEWSLLSINGNPPSEMQLARYRKEKKKEAKRERNEGENRFDTLAAPGSIALIEEDEQQAVYSFKPLAESEKDDEINEQLEGRLVIRKDGPWVSSFELKNLGRIAPAPLVRIDRMHIKMRFAPVAENGPYLPLEMHSSVAGKLAGLKKISEDKKIAFSDYTRAAQSP